MKMELDVHKIKQERKKRAWTQQHLADVADLSLRTVQRIESSGFGGAESTKAIAAVFNNIEASDLYLHTSIKENTDNKSKHSLWFNHPAIFTATLVFIISIFTLSIFSNSAIGDTTTYHISGSVRIDNEEVYEFDTSLHEKQIRILDLDSRHTLILETTGADDDDKTTIVSLLKNDGKAYNVLHKAVRHHTDSYSQSVSYRLCNDNAIFYSPAVVNIPRCDEDPNRVSRG